MKFVDRTKLKIKLIESGMSIKDLADELCITYAGLYNKLSNNRDFNENEIFVLDKLFGKDVFFMDSDVSNLNTKYARRNRKSNKST